MDVNFIILNSLIRDKWFIVFQHRETEKKILIVGESGKNS